MSEPYSLEKSTYGKWFAKGPGSGMGGDGCSPYCHLTFVEESEATRAVSVANAAYNAGYKEAQSEIRKALLRALGIGVDWQGQLKLF